jgi:hypothetical protein
MFNQKIKKVMKKLFLLYCVFAAIHAFAQKKQVSNYKIVTTDVANFIRIFNTVDSANRITTYQSEYLDKGSDGLKDYATLRFHSAGGLVERIYGSPDFYKKLIVTLTNTDFDAISKSCVAPINKFTSLYDGAIIPNIYLLVGGLYNGSTPGKTGLLIGLDSYLLCFTDRSKIVNLHNGIAHELIHFNQSFIANDSLSNLIENNLLAQVIKEGSADFLGELLSGSVEYCNLEMYQWGEKHIQQLWAEFKEDIKDSSKTSKWLYNDQTDRPMSLGYFMGYKITKAYYNKAKDKKQAIKDILNIRHDKFYEFLAKSGYSKE